MIGGLGRECSVRLSSLFILILLSSCSDNNHFDNMLIQSIKVGDLSKARIALSNGAKINYKCPENTICSPVISAVMSDRPAMVSLFLSNGADVDTQNGAANDSLLVYALTGGNEEIIDMVLNAGADINLPNKFGITPFMGVCLEADETKISKLLSHGANVNELFSLYDTEGITPLMLSAKAGNIEAVRVLISAGAKKDLRDSKNMGAIDYLQNEQNEIEQLLSNH